ncbi:cytochrome P450 [Streptosporangiaceae bacterium NEAU-GS5]|nr:cytochrome P450 [Streptosporangiaceae bacterium NEAU-GS5]
MDFPLASRPGVGLDSEYLKVLRSEPLVAATLPMGRDVLLVTRHADVRTVLADDRFSREAWANGTLWARRTETLALVTSDPPTHGYRRRAVQSWFTKRKADAARPAIKDFAERLVDGLEIAGPPGDLVSAFAMPFAYGIICDMLGTPPADLDALLPWATAMMSAGRHTKDEIAAAHEGMLAYYTRQLAIRREAIAAGMPGDDLLTALVVAGDLSDPEIIIMGLGLMTAGGDTTSNFLMSCVLELLSRPELVAQVRADPARIAGVVDECLRYIWFGATGGQPHVVMSEVELAGTCLSPGQVVIPMVEVANRDPSVFDAPDEFRPGRDTNPHMGWGYGRHMCLGAAHARIELEVAIETLLRRLDGLAIDVDVEGLRWRDRMFIRGLWSLPVTWKKG